VYVRAGKTAFVIDTPPEFRLACLELKIAKVDAVVLTHAHMDHVAGFDDVRRFNTINGKTVLRCYAAPETVEAMHHLFPYITTKANKLGLYRPMIDFRPVRRAFRIGCAKLTPLPVEHGGPRTNGYLIEAEGKRAAYVPDCCALPDRVVRKLRGVDVMVLDCLRARPHPTHLTMDQTVAYMKAIAPRRGYITHMCHDLTHAEWLRLLPRPVRPAYDGLKIVC
jgi:phosphoribosyl 1,2-cyclic phosphate phosphodiesterase